MNYSLKKEKTEKTMSNHSDSETSERPNCYLCGLRSRDTNQMLSFDRLSFFPVLE